MADEDIQGAEETPAEPVDSGTPAHVKKHVAEWLDRIKHAEKCHETAFKRMRECMDIVAHGAKKEWAESDKYVVPVISRHINLAVAQLYAKNPKAAVKRKKRRLHTVWDGRPETIENAKMTAEAAQAGMVPDMVAAEQAMMEYQSLVEDIQAAEQYNRFAKGAAETLEILWDHVLDEQTLGTKKQLKSLVRRTKTNGVGYVKMGFQREFQPTPEQDSRIQDMTQQLARLQQLQREAARGDLDEDSGELAELEASLRAIQQQVPLVREGLVLSYPRSTRIIIDPACHGLRTLAGAKWIAECIYLTAREIETIYGVKVESGQAKAMEAFDYESDSSKRRGAIRVYEVQDKESGLFFTVCEGHDGYLETPDNPPIFLERFFTVFPLVFNEVEHETELFPASDVWRARHMQEEYNRSREARREHRIAARPYYVSRKGALETEEKHRLATHAAHEIIEVIGLQDNQGVDAILQRGPVNPIDPNLYETDTITTDILHAIGVQEANLGGLSGATATEASIGESSRVSAVSDNVDDLDELLTELARAGSQVLLAEMSKEMVSEIVGPGAVWPDAPPTRIELAKELVLSVKAGSSGRPNKAAEIANIERAAPFLLQLPGVNPRPLAEKYAELLDIDPDELYQEGALSVVAQNTMVGKTAGPAGPETGTPSTESGPVPAAQGGQGGSRSQTEESGRQQGPQPSFRQPDQSLAAVS